MRNIVDKTILHSSIDNDTRLKLLECVRLFNDIRTAEGNPYDSRIGHIKENGKLGVITSEDFQTFLPQEYETIVVNTISNIVKEYVETSPLLSTFKNPSFELFHIFYCIMEEGDFHTLHNHDSNYSKDKDRYGKLSGTIYLEVPKNLEWPQGNFSLIVENYINKEETDNIWQRAPKAGDTVTWPSLMIHSAYPFRSKEQRILIGYNCEYKEG